MVDVDNSLRVAQVILHILTICGGLMTGIGLGWTVTIFSENCLLYSNMVLTQSTFRNQSIRIDGEETEWGTVEVCYYCMFSSVVAAIYAIIWFWFYLLLSDWDNSLDFKNNFINFTKPHFVVEITKKRPPDLKLFVPTLLLLVVLFVNTLISLGLLTAGSRAWCNGVQDSLGKQCSYLGQVGWDLEYGEFVYTYVRIAQAGSWVLILSVFATIVIVATRIHLYYGNNKATEHYEAIHSDNETKGNDSDGIHDSDDIINDNEECTRLSVLPTSRVSSPSYYKTADKTLVKRSITTVKEASERTKLSPDTVKKKYNTV